MAENKATDSNHVTVEVVEVGSAEDSFEFHRLETRPMTEGEAHQCIENIKDLGKSIRMKLLDLDLRQGWAALGYPSMTACIKDQFSEAGSKSNLIREWNAGQMERELEVQICTYPAYQLRPLRKLAPEQRQAALRVAQEIAGDGRLTANHVTQVVSQLLKPQSFKTKPVIPPILPYKSGEIILINCDRAVKEAYAQYNGCWGVVVEVLAYGCKVDLIGQKWSINWNDLKEIDVVDETLKSAALRVVALLQRDDLDDMEREILESYHRREWFTDWQLRLLQTIESLRLNNSPHF